MRWSLWRRNALRVAFEASTPDLPLMPRSPSRPQCWATRRTTISHRVLAAALLSKVSRKRAKSCSVRVSPITPATLPMKPAIRVGRRDLRLGLEADRLGHMRLVAALGIVGPVLRQIQSIGDRQAGMMIGDRQRHR